MPCAAKKREDMTLEIQRGNSGKRIIAYIFDGILTGILAVLFVYIISQFLHYDEYSERLEALMKQYQETYNISFDITNEEFAQLEEAEQQRLLEAQEAMDSDPEAVELFAKILSSTFLMTSLGILLALAITEFAVPLLFKDGRTLGKKVFGLAVMNNDWTHLKTFNLFARTFLGKYTIETMVPVALIIGIYFQYLGRTGVMILGMLLLLQILLYTLTRNHTCIHDLLGGCVVVDYNSQHIFDTPQERTAYIAEAAALHRDAYDDYRRPDTYENRSSADSENGAAPDRNK